MEAQGGDVIKEDGNRNRTPDFSEAVVDDLGTGQIQFPETQ